MGIKVYEKLFIVITLIVSWLVSIVFVSQGAIGGLVIVMFVPAVMAVVIILAREKSLKKLVEPFMGKITFKGILFSIVCPLGIIFLCAIAALITKQGKLTVSVEELAKQVIGIVGVSIPFALITLGEEYGWRGFLLPIMIQKYGLRKANIVIGLVWALYHLPVVLMVNLNQGMGNAIIYALIQMACVWLVNFSYTYLYGLSQNILLPAMMHSIWNNINTLILGDAYRNLDSGLISGNVRLINGEGLFGMLFLGITAMMFYRSMTKKQAWVNEKGNDTCSYGE